MMVHMCSTHSSRITNCLVTELTINGLQQANTKNNNLHNFIMSDTLCHMSYDLIAMLCEDCIVVCGSDSVY